MAQLFASYQEENGWSAQETPHRRSSTGADLRSTPSRLRAGCAPRDYSLDEQRSRFLGSQTSTRHGIACRFAFGIR
jgi:hypothetical protein